VRAQEWRGVFRDFDKNHNGTIDGDELQLALKKWGFELSTSLQLLLKRKYGAMLSSEHPTTSAHCSCLLNLDVNWVSEKTAAGGGATAAPPADQSTWSGITLDRFVRACVVVKQLKESFGTLETDANGWAKINYETFVNMVFTLP